MCFFNYSKLEEKNQQLDQALDESRQNQKEYEETSRQIEEDADREILDMKNKYERRLRDEKEANSRLKGETGILTKKVGICNIIHVHVIVDQLCASRAIVGCVASYLTSITFYWLLILSIFTFSSLHWRKRLKDTKMK